MGPLDTPPQLNTAIVWLGVHAERYTLRLLFIAVFVPFLCQCQLGLRTASRRGIEGLVRPEKNYQQKSRQIPENSNRPQDDEEISIVKSEKDNKYYTGSLFTVEHGYTDLYAEFKTPRVGDYLDVKIVPMSPAAAEPTAGAAPDAAAPGAGETDPDLAQIIAGLPQLEQEPGSPAKLITSMRMRIDAVKPNGSVLVSYKRLSKNPYSEKSLEVRALVPFEVALGREEINTRDLREVEFFDDGEGFYSQREAQDWQDEYSLRISGFTEAKSIYAKNLEDQRNQVKQMKTEIEQKAVAMGKERRTMAAERARIMEQNAIKTARITELENQLRDQPVPAQVQPPVTVAPAEAPPVSNINDVAMP